MLKVPMELRPFVRMSRTELICNNNLPESLVPLFEQTKEKLKKEIDEKKKKFEK